MATLSVGMMHKNKRCLVIFINLIFLVSSIVHANTLECVPIENNHPLAVKDPYGEGFIFKKSGLEAPFYDGKVIFSKVESKVKKFHKLPKDENIFCDFKEGIVFCPGKKQSKLLMHKKPVYHGHNFLFKLPVKVKREGMFKIERKDPLFPEVDKYLPVELFSIYGEPHKARGFNKSGVFSYMRTNFSFWAFEGEIFALPGGDPKDWEGLAVANFCFLDLNLKEIKPFTRDLSKPPKYQKR